MQQERKSHWLAPWRRRQATAWGSLLDEQEVLLAALSRQQGGGVRVLVFERLRAPAGLNDAAAREDWLVQTLRVQGVHLPARLRTMALALREGRCRHGTLLWEGAIPSAALEAEVQLEAAAALGVDPSQIGFDYRVQAQTPSAPTQVQWAACLRSELQHWQGHARNAGWRLPVVEPEHQAARRAAMCLRGDPIHWATSAQDWQFSALPEREVTDAQWQQWQTSALWGPLVACGAALGALL